MKKFSANFKGEAETGEALCKDPKIAKISFTGSVPTGLAVQRNSAVDSLKGVGLLFLRTHKARGVVVPCILRKKDD